MEHPAGRAPVRGPTAPRKGHPAALAQVPGDAARAANLDHGTMRMPAPPSAAPAPGQAVPRTLNGRVPCSGGHRAYGLGVRNTLWTELWITVAAGLIPGWICRPSAGKQFAGGRPIGGHPPGRHVWPETARYRDSPVVAVSPQAGMFHVKHRIGRLGPELPRAIFGPVDRMRRTVALRHCAPDFRRLGRASRQPMFHVKHRAKEIVEPETLSQKPGTLPFGSRS